MSLLALAAVQRAHDARDIVTGILDTSAERYDMNATSVLRDFMSIDMSMLRRQPLGSAVGREGEARVAGGMTTTMMRFGSRPSERIMMTGDCDDVTN